MARLFTAQQMSATADVRIYWLIDPCEVGADLFNGTLGAGAPSSLQASQDSNQRLGLAQIYGANQGDVLLFGSGADRVAGHCGRILALAKPD